MAAAPEPVRVLLSGAWLYLALGRWACPVRGSPLSPGDYDITPTVGPRSETGTSFALMCREPVPLNLGVSAHAESSWRHLTERDVQVYNPSVFWYSGMLLALARSGGPPHDTCRDPRFALWVLTRELQQASPVVLFTHGVNVSALAVRRGLWRARPDEHQGRSPKGRVRELCLSRHHRYPECCQHGMRNEDARVVTIGGHLIAVYHRHRRMYLQTLLPGTHEELRLRPHARGGGGGAGRDGHGARGGRGDAAERGEGGNASEHSRQRRLARADPEADDADEASALRADSSAEGRERGRNEKNWAPWHQFPPWHAREGSARSSFADAPSGPAVAPQPAAGPVPSWVLLTYSIWPHVVLNCSTAKARRAAPGARSGCVEVARTDTRVIFEPVEQACASSAAHDTATTFAHAKDARKGCVFGVHLGTNTLPVPWPPQPGEGAGAAQRAPRARAQACEGWRMLGVFAVKDYVHNSYAAYFYVTSACPPYDVLAVGRRPIELAAVPLACKLLTGFQCVTYATALHWADASRTSVALGYGYQDRTSRVLIQPLTAVLASLEWVRPTARGAAERVPEAAAAQWWPANPLARLAPIAVTGFDLSAEAGAAGGVGDATAEPAASPKPRLVLVLAYHRMGAFWLRQLLRFVATDLKREIHKAWVKSLRRQKRRGAGETGEAAFVKPEPILCEGGFAEAHPCFATFGRSLSESVCFDGAARSTLLAAAAHAKQAAAKAAAAAPAAADGRDAGSSSAGGSDPASSSPDRDDEQPASAAPPLFLAVVFSPTAADLHRIGEHFDYRALSLVRDPRDVLLSAARAHRSPVRQAPWDTVPPWLEPRRARGVSAADELDAVPRRARAGEGPERGPGRSGPAADTLFGGLPWIASSVAIREAAERTGTPPIATSAHGVSRTLPPWLTQPGGTRFDLAAGSSERARPRSYLEAARARADMGDAVSFEAEHVGGCVLRAAHEVYAASDERVLFVRYEDVASNYKVAFHRISKWLFPQTVAHFDVAKAFETAAHKLMALTLNATGETSPLDAEELQPLADELRSQGAWCDEAARDTSGVWARVQRQFGSIIRGWGYEDCLCSPASA